MLLRVMFGVGSGKTEGACNSEDLAELVTREVVKILSMLIKTNSLALVWLEIRGAACEKFLHLAGDANPLGGEW